MCYYVHMLSNHAELTENIMTTLQITTSKIGDALFPRYSSTIECTKCGEDNHGEHYASKRCDSVSSAKFRLGRMLDSGFECDCEVV